MHNLRRLDELRKMLLDLELQIKKSRSAFLTAKGGAERGKICHYYGAELNAAALDRLGEQLQGQKSAQQLEAAPPLHSGSA